MYSPEQQYQLLLKPLYIGMQRSRQAYSDYLGAKLYWQAETIRQCNREIYRLLISRAALIPGILQPDVIALLNHYTAWFLQFRAHKKKIKPGLNDVFVFHRLEQQPPFPGQAEKNIFAFYEKLKQELETTVTAG